MELFENLFLKRTIFSRRLANESCYEKEVNNYFILKQDIHLKTSISKYKTVAL